MSTVSLLALLAGSWGVIMSISPLLQIRAMVRVGSSAGVSLGHLRVLLVGFAVWLSYGIALGDLALIVTNGMAMAVGATTIAVAARYRPRPLAPPPIEVGASSSQ